MINSIFQGIPVAAFNAATNQKVGQWPTLKKAIGELTGKYVRHSIVDKVGKNKKPATIRATKKDGIRVYMKSVITKP